jgi:hypothetical protein
MQPKPLLASSLTRNLFSPKKPKFGSRSGWIIPQNMGLDIIYQMKPPEYFSTTQPKLF